MDVVDLKPEEAASLERLVAEICEAVRRGGATKTALFARLAEDIDRLNGYMRIVADGAARSGAHAACRAGCAWCCHQHVHVSAAEAFFLADRIERSPGAAALKARVQEIAAKLDGMGAEQRFRERIACPLLDGATGLCAAYEARPFICRGNNSLSWTACKTAFRTGDAHRSVGAIRAVFMLGFLARRGYVDGLAKAGLPSRSLELAAALAVIFRTPNAFDRWAGGEDVFQD